MCFFAGHNTCPLSSLERVFFFFLLPSLNFFFASLSLFFFLISFELRDVYGFFIPKTKFIIGKTTGVDLVISPIDWFESRGSFFTALI